MANREKGNNKLPKNPVVLRRAPRNVTLASGHTVPKPPSESEGETSESNSDNDKLLGLSAALRKEKRIDRQIRASEAIRAENQRRGLHSQSSAGGAAGSSQSSQPGRHTTAPQQEAARFTRQSGDFREPERVSFRMHDSWPTRDT